MALIDAAAGADIKKQLGGASTRGAARREERETQASAMVGAHRARRDSPVARLATRVVGSDKAGPGYRPCLGKGIAPAGEQA